MTKHKISSIFVRNFKTMSKYNVKSHEGTLIPDWIVEKMLDEQERQGNKRDVSVFEKFSTASSNAGGFDWHSSCNGENYWIDIIVSGIYREQPVEKKYPRVMMVSDYGEIWFKRVVEFEKEVRGKLHYFAWRGSETIEDSLEKTQLNNWKMAKEIEPEKQNKIELTLDEIAEKFGVSVENLKIKK